MKLEKLRALVEEMYNANHKGRDDWASWLYDNHVLWVANKTETFCEKFGGNKDIAVGAALVHDIADAVMQREQPGHEQKSLDVGKELAIQAGYSPEEINIMIDDIALKHSCRDGVVPTSNEGKLMSAADACAHFQTDFYLHAFSEGSNFGDYEWMKSWVRKKIERDYTNKIFHEEIRNEVRPDYEALKRMFSY